MFLLTLISVGGGVAHSLWSGYTIYRGRNVCLGKVRLSNISPIGTHWAVQVDNNFRFWKPAWFEIEGKISYAQWYATTNIGSSKGGTSRLGAEPCQDVGVTKKTDDDIDVFNEQWAKEHPDYYLLSDNCQMYATDFIGYLCGPEAVKTLPWQEGQVVVQTSKWTATSIAAVSGVSIAWWAVNKVIGG